MPRSAREYSSTGLYHIIFRGVNKQSIFIEKSDFLKFKKLIIKLKQEMKFEIYVYCLMSNHVHFILKENSMGDLPLIMKRLLTVYAMYFNKKYSRTGPVFESRYKSNPIEVDNYFMAVVRYIHRNPLKANIVQNLSDYTWSSYYEYVMETDGIADKEFVTEMLDKDDFISFHQQDVEFELFEIDNKKSSKLYQINRELISVFSISPEEVVALSEKQKTEVLSYLASRYSIRLISESTGISRFVLKNYLQ